MQPSQSFRSKSGDGYDFLKKSSASEYAEIVVRSNERQGVLWAYELPQPVVQDIAVNIATSSRYTLVSEYLPVKIVQDALRNQ